MGAHAPLNVQNDIYNWIVNLEKMFGLGKTSKHDFTFVFVHECERVPFKKNQEGFMCNGVW
jgi:hypothetical protein